MEQPEKYRHFVVNQVSSLKVLDGHCIVDSEVIEGLKQVNQLPQIEQRPDYSQDDKVQNASATGDPLIQRSPWFPRRHIHLQ